MVNKDELIQLCVLTSTCIRDYDSLYRQYRECIYNDIDVSKPTEDKLNLYYRYNSIGIKMLMQRVICVDKGILIYILKDYMVVVIGSDVDIHDSTIPDRITQFIRNYKKITSNVCPTVMWCGVYMFFENHNNIMSLCIDNLKGLFLSHDVFIIGNVKKNVSILKKNKAIRKYTCIALQEESADKKHHITLKGYSFDIKTSTIFEYLLTIMNRMSNFQ